MEGIKAELLYQHAYDYKAHGKACRQSEDIDEGKRSVAPDISQRHGNIVSDHVWNCLPGILQINCQSENARNQAFFRCRINKSEQDCALVNGYNILSP